MQGQQVHAPGKNNVADWRDSEARNAVDGMQISRAGVKHRSRDLCAEIERRDKADEEKKKPDLRLLRSSSGQLREVRENRERLEQAYKK